MRHGGPADRLHPAGAPDRPGQGARALFPLMAADTAKGTVLLCLDIQPVFLKAVAGGDRFLDRCRFAVAAAAGLGIPVAFTEQVPAKLGATEATLSALAGKAEVH